MTKYIARPFTFVAIGLCTLSLPAWSAEKYEGMGEITASIDGKPYTAITLSQTSRHSSSATFHPVGGMTMVSIQGYDLDTGDVMENVLNLEVSLMGGNASAKIFDAKITYWPEGMDGPFYTNDQTGHNVSLSWDALSLGDDATAKGTFETTLCRQESFFSEVDANNCQDVVGSFETGLDRKEL